MDRKSTLTKPLAYVGGSPAEAKVFNPNIGKLDPKIVSCHLFGYLEKSKGFHFLLFRETYKVCGNETRCLPRGQIDEGEHGSSRNWPWSEAGVSAHSNDLWANFLTTCCSCTDSARYCGASTCCYPTCGNNECRWGTCSLGFYRTYCHTWWGSNNSLK